MPKIVLLRVCSLRLLPYASCLMSRGESLHTCPQAWLGPAGAFLIFAVLAVTAVVFIWELVPETKGLSLEEIQHKLAAEL